MSDDWRKKTIVPLFKRCDVLANKLARTVTDRVEKISELLLYQEQDRSKEEERVQTRFLYLGR